MCAFALVCYVRLWQQRRRSTSSGGASARASPTRDPCRRHLLLLLIKRHLQKEEEVKGPQFLSGVAVRATTAAVTGAAVTQLTCSICTGTSAYCARRYSHRVKWIVTREKCMNGRRKIGVICLAITRNVTGKNTIASCASLLCMSSFGRKQKENQCASCMISPFPSFNLLICYSFLAWPFVNWHDLAPNKRVRRIPWRARLVVARAAAKAAAARRTRGNRSGVTVQKNDNKRLRNKNGNFRCCT